MTMNTKYLALLAAALLLPASVFAQESTTTFRIDKIWEQGGDQDALNAREVTAHLSCTGANITQQNVVFTATTDAILFVYDISQIPEDAEVDCKIWEDVPENYMARYECDVTEEKDGDCEDSSDQRSDCFFPDVARNDFNRSEESYRCNIYNTPKPAVVTVTKTWILEGADQGFDESHQIEAKCWSGQEEAVVGGVGSDIWGCGDGCWGVDYEVGDAVDGTYEFTILRPDYPSTSCDFYEESVDSVVEGDNGCEGISKVSAGDDLECEIVNTVFFEGIPTLNQYGMAILALMMLGVGFVGFRRFV